MTTRSIAAFAACALTLHPFGALAKSQSVDTTAQDHPAAAETGQGNVGDILVVARKRVEPLSQTPIAVTAITGDTLRARGLTTLSDIATVTPGVSFREDVGGRAGPSITVRGIGFDDYHALGTPSAAVYVDQVYQGSNAWIAGQLYDIDHVEILKGPQGTLYGQNTTSGAINVLTAQPTDATRGFVTASYGSYDALRVEGGVGGTLATDLTGRIAFLRQSGGGFLTSEGNAAQAGTTPVPDKIPPLPLVGRQTGFGDRDYWGTRGILRYAPSSFTTITAEASYGRDRGANSQSDVLGRSAELNRTITT